MGRAHYTDRNGRYRGSRLLGFIKYSLHDLEMRKYYDPRWEIRGSIDTLVLNKVYIHDNLDLRLIDTTIEEIVRREPEVQTIDIPKSLTWSTIITPGGLDNTVSEIWERYKQKGKFILSDDHTSYYGSDHDLTIIAREK